MGNYCPPQNASETKHCTKRTENASLIHLYVSLGVCCNLHVAATYVINFRYLLHFCYLVTFCHLLNCCCLLNFCYLLKLCYQLLSSYHLCHILTLLYIPALHFKHTTLTHVLFSQYSVPIHFSKQRGFLAIAPF